LIFLRVKMRGNFTYCLVKELDIIKVFVKARTF